MFQRNPRKILGLVTAVFLSMGARQAMAQTAEGPGNTSAGVYSGPEGGPQWPLEVYVPPTVGGYYAGVGVGNGAAAAVAGHVNSSGQVNAVGAGTQTPGEVCPILPGTEIPYDCN
jgi:hypothetical protein